MDSSKHYYDFDQLEKRFKVNFINSLSGFKSANLIGTANENGQSNLAIISSVVHLGANPPLMAYINRPASVARHTLDNILKTKQFTLNHVNNDIIAAAHQTSARYLADQSEFSETGLNEVFIEGFDAPFVAESHIKIGLRYVEHHTLLNDTVLVIGEVEHVFLPGAAVLDDGFIDIESCGTVAVSGLDSYHQPSQLVRMAYAKPDLPPSTVDTIRSQVKS